MSYEFDLHNVPGTLAVGEPFDPRLEVCCTNPDGCPDVEVEMFLDGDMVGGLSFVPIADDCMDLRAGSHWSSGGVDRARDSPDAYDVDYEELAIYEPGEYTISTDANSQTATVEVVGPTFDIVGCSTPQTTSVGEPVDAVATIENVGGVDGTATISILVDGEVVENVDVDVPSGEAVEQPVELDFPEPGEYAIEFEVGGF